MNRREFFKGAAALAAVAPLASKEALAHAAKPKAGNNPIWLMTSAFASDPDFESVVARAKNVGAQGLELCVFRRDTDRQDHIATHLDYDNFTPERAKKVIEICNREGLRIMREGIPCERCGRSERCGTLEEFPSVHGRNSLNYNVPAVTIMFALD